MNRKKLFFITFLLALAFLSSCTNDDELDYLVIDFFVDVEARDNVHLNIYHGSPYSVSFSGDGSAQDVDFYVEGQKLILTGNEHGNHVEVNIIHPTLRNIVVKNNAEVQFKNDFETLAPEFSIEGFDAAKITSKYAVDVDTIDIELFNASKLAFDSLNTDHMEMYLTDGTRCNIQGSASTQYVDMENGCRFNLDYPEEGWDIDKPVMGDSIWVEVDNGANAWVYPMEYLHAEGNTGSRVFYKGDPSNIESDMSNGAEIYQKSE